MKTKPATIRDVAHASGVSTATVSYVLNNGPRRVDPVTKARVEAAMQRLQYHPNTMARGLLRKRLNSLGVVFPQPYPGLVTDSYFGAILDGIIHVATEQRQDVMLFTSVEWRGHASLPAFRDRRVDGLLLIAPLTDSDIVPALADAGIPLVLINCSSDDPRIATVDVDNEKSVQNVIAHLASLGHRRIGLLGGQPNSPSTAPRRQGFEIGMKEHGLALDPAIMLEGTYTQEWGYEGMCRILSQPNPPTAVFAGGDGIALGAYRACAEEGVSIPGQMSIVGFDDAAYASHLSPTLTTVRQPLTQLGAAATSILLEFLDNDQRGTASPAKKIVLPTEVVARQSTAAPQPSKDDVQNAAKILSRASRTKEMHDRAEGAELHLNAG